MGVRGERVENAGEWTVGFLAALRRTPNVLRAAKAAGISRAMAYKEREADPVFRKEWDEAIADAIENIEAVALDLAKNRDPKHNNLRMFVLRAHKRDVYGEKTDLTVRGSRAEPLQVNMAMEGLDHVAGILAVLADVGVLPPGIGGADAAEADEVYDLAAVGEADGVTLAV